MAKRRDAVRRTVTVRLDQARRTAGVTKEISRLTIDRCRRGNDDAKNTEDFLSICSLIQQRAYVWDGDVNGFLDRFPKCDSTPMNRDEWRRMHGKPAPVDPARTFDAGDLPGLECSAVEIEFVTSATSRRDLETLKPGAIIMDPESGIDGPYHWVVEGKPWLADWLKIRGKNRFLVAMSTIEDYAVDPRRTRSPLPIQSHSR
ncbi:hypothetical protein [Microtetraspora niveoalba]|uniref:hypothetical protein n=1 Tax=Microtetraspora niveoalba TaxID=46175 RepID=UPI0012F7B9DD|nr:hypothetical protein [Microtetraspora niveoalba]